MSLIEIEQGINDINHSLKIKRIYSIPKILLNLTIVYDHLIDAHLLIGLVHLESG